MTQELSTLSSNERRQFHLHACLGRGGFGEVYRATMMSSGGVRAEVAVKVMHAEVDPESQSVQRLRDEGRLLGAVRHPVVLKVHDLVLLDGRVALVTEYVEGQDLDKCIQSRDPAPTRVMVEIIAKIADALQTAWTAPAPNGEGPLQLVHRDIKPANIRLGKHGEVKLLDFGIARAANVQREAHTETNALLGSYLYMAPERFLEHGDSGPAVDIYALGLILYEGIARRRMFGEKSLKDLYLLVLDADRYNTYIRSQLEVIPKGVPHQIVALIFRTLDLDPARRPDHNTLARTCHELADKLPGASLDRWARSRAWPASREVQGVLDGAIITETAFGSITSTGRSPGGNATPAPLGPKAGTTSAIFDLRAVTATLDRPGVVAAAGVGLFGALGLASLLLGLAMFGLAALWWTSREPEVVFVEPARPEIAAPIAAPIEPAVEPVAPAPAPRAQPVAAPRPVPQPTPQPVSQPEPAPQLQPQPQPVPRPSTEAMATVTIEGGVRVLFVGKDKTYPAGLLPAGLYEIRAYFDPTAPLPQGKLHVNPGDRLRVKCSTLSQRCEVL